MSSTPPIPQSLDEAINQAQDATQKALDDGFKTFTSRISIS